MKRQLVILHSVLYESAERLSVNPGRDWSTIQSRYKDEGESFLAITLPAMHDHVLECVSAGVWSPSRLFKNDAKGCPVFLQGFLGLIFDLRGTGTVRSGAMSVWALHDLRQILLLHSKVRAMPTQERQQAALDGFLRTERDLQDGRTTILANLRERNWIEVSDMVYRDIFSQVDTMLLDDKILFKHGPGSTADGSFGSAKFVKLRETWTSRLEHCFPMSDFGYTNLHHFQDACPNYDYVVVSPRDELPMKVTLVPKTQKTPRIIAMEPTAMQFAQQGILGLLDEAINGSSLRDYISWRDQNRNQVLACQGSRDQSLATLDLSEASDRVHVSLVNAMLRRHHLLRKAVFASRSTSAELQGKFYVLEKFAPMGSALCFAFETLAFFSMVVASELERKGIPVSALRMKNGKLNLPLLQGISAYGDDIIVPTAGALPAIEYLEAFGLKVNRRKSFWTGEFRESCGGDYFRGLDVSVVRLREKIPCSRQDLKETWSLTQFQNQLFRAGFWKSAAKTAELAPWVPTVDGDLHSGIYFLGEENSAPTRYNPYLYRTEYKVLNGKFFTPVYKANGWDMLHKSLIALHARKGPPSVYQDFPYDRRPELVSLRPTWIAAIH